MPDGTGTLDRAHIKREAQLVGWSLGLLTAHLLGMFLAGFSKGQIPLLTKAVTLLGLLAIPLCSWLVSRWVDRWVSRLPLREVVIASIRLGAAIVAIALLPSFFQILTRLPLPLIGRVLELGTVVLSIAVMSGLVLLGFAVADLLYLATARIKRMATRMMLLLLLAALGTFLWLSLLGLQSHAILTWALEQGHLQGFVAEPAWLTRLGGAWIGTMAGALSLELPFILIMAWRFGQNATGGLAALNAGFSRVAKGELNKPVPVIGSDEIADMQRGFNAMLEAARERRFLETAFGRYVSPLILDRIRHTPDSAQWVGERVDATVLFSDVRGFTAMSAALKPEEVIELLNVYFSLLIEVVTRFDGYINKFIGDAMMVVWNTPLPDEKHALRAMACAAAMQEALAQANAEGRFGDAEVKTGIGLNSGPLVAGNLGNQQVAEFTMIGDSVNVASRACSAAGPDQIALTHATLMAAQKEAGQDVACADLGVVDLKGKGPTPMLALEESALSLKAMLQKNA
jgi:class 3 adenylate cyclase